MRHKKICFIELAESTRCVLQVDKETTDMAMAWRRGGDMTSDTHLLRTKKRQETVISATFCGTTYVSTTTEAEPGIIYET